LYLPTYVLIYSYVLQYKDVQDPTIVDQLVFRGISELEEAKLQWKTKSHVMRYFSPILNKAAAVDAVLQRKATAIPDRFAKVAL